VTALETAFWLLVAHALCDFPLQADYLALHKNKWAGYADWPWALAAHSLIQGGGVALVTGSVGLGLAEAVLHAAIDNLKCAQRISYNVDQTLHIACKLVWWVIAGYA
jgi:hypothetical protein